MLKSCLYLYSRNKQTNEKKETNRKKRINMGTRVPIETRGKNFTN